MAVPTEGDDILFNDPFNPRETINALGGNDIITLTRPDPPIGPGGLVTTVDGGDGNDTLIVNANVRLNSLQASGFGGSLNLRLNSLLPWQINWQSIENTEISAFATFGAPIILGESNDTLRLSGSFNFGSQAQLYTGGGADKVYLSGEFQGFEGEFIRTEAGDDLIDLSAVNSLFNLPTGTGQLRAYGGDGADTIVGSIFDDILRGEAGGDRIDAGEGNDQLIGGTGVDVLIGGEGDDQLNGEAGADVMLGGAGDDRYAVDDAGDIVIEFPGEGNDTILASANFSLLGSSDVENLQALDPAGTAALVLVGSSVANRIIGNAGDNTLNGGGGADTLEGRGGNDSYYVDNAGDVIVEAAGGGFDRVYTRIDYTLSSGAELEFLATTSLAGTTPLRLTGNDLANQIHGNAGENILDGGAGADLMYGYGGNDIYFVEQQGDQALEAAGQGYDRVNAFSNYILSSFYEVEVLAAASPNGFGLLLVGNNLNNEIIGTYSGDTLSGDVGADALYGGIGNDIYYVDQQGDLIFDSAGEGVDIVYSWNSYALRPEADVEYLFVIGNATGVTLEGNALANNVFGGANGDTLDGGAGRDLLYGLGGNDIFRFTATGESNADTIVDFTVTQDRIGLESDVFTGLPLGALPAGAFVAGTSAAEADDRILYDQPTGRLFFDADGSGNGAAVLFAILDSRPVISAADFVVI